MIATASFDGVPVVSTTELGKRIGIKVSSADLKALQAVAPFAETSTGIYWREDDVFVISKALADFITKRAGLLELQRIAAEHQRRTASAKTAAPRAE